MATKLEKLTNLAHDHAQNLTKSVDNWTEFLKSSAWLYKYPFHKQLLIHAQRPNATACATIDVWNNSLNRWVNKGAKGIAIIDDTTPTPVVKHVFDVSDTHNSGDIPFVLWQMKQGYEEKIIEELTDHFGEIESTGNFYGDIILVVKNTVQDNISDYAQPITELKHAFLQILQCSVLYTALHRLGYDASKYVTNEDFNALKHFNTYNRVTTLGTANADISEMILRQIERSVKTLDKVAQKEEVVQNDTITQKGGFKNGDNLHKAGGLSHSRLNIGGNTQKHRQVRNDAEKLPYAPQQSNVQRTADEWQANITLSGDRQPSKTADTADNKSTDESTRRNRATESHRPNEVDRADEQHQSPSGRIGVDGDSQQLNIFKGADQSASFVSQGIIDEVLCNGSNARHSPHRICAYFKKSKTDNAKFLKQEYQTGGKGYIIDGSKISVWFSDEGIHIHQGESAKNSPLTLTYEEAENRISKLLNTGKYMSGEDYAKVDDIEKDHIANYLCDIWSDDFGGLPEKFGPRLFPQVTNKIKGFLENKTQLAQLISEYEERLKQPLDKHYHNVQVFLQELKDYALTNKEFPPQTYIANHQRFITQDEIEMLIKRGGGIQQSKMRIYEYFEKEKDAYKRASFLSHEYGIGGASPGLFNVDDSHENHDSKGLSLSRGSITKPYAKVLLSWKQVAKGVATLIAKAEYLTPKEREYYPKYLRETQQARLTAQQERYEAEALRQTAEKLTQQAESKRANGKYVFSLGDAVYMGNSTRTILGISDEVITLNDPKYPLFTEDMPREKFESRLRENPLNDGFIVENSAETVNVVPEVATKTNELLHFDNIQNIDLSTYKDGDDVGYDKNGVLHTVRKMGNITYTTQTVDIIPTKNGWVYENSTAPQTPKQTETAPQNYIITDDNLGYGGAKTKYKYNIEAIKTLQLTEKENRNATPQEQEVLAKYVGWGGIPQAVDESNTSWANEYLELKGLLTNEEYISARESTLNAHYTSPTVIKAIYSFIEKTGFSTGNILEPACGVGNFLGLLPQSMSNSKLYGVELDSITARIAKKLYPLASIEQGGFENTQFQEQFFDVAVGNVPFGNYGVSDAKYDKHNFLIHDYFFAKTLDKVRPGGIIAFVTSSGTMDKKNNSVRKYLAQRAELIGAIRLPNNAFLANAGTSVVADILFLQKRDRVMDIEPNWIFLDKTQEGYSINSYFTQNPHMVLGEITTESTQYGNSEITVKAIEGRDLGEQLQIATESLSAHITDFEHDDIEENTTFIPADPNVRNFSFVIVEGEIYFRENSRMNKTDATLTAQNRIKGMIGIRDCARKLIEAQLEGAFDDEIQDLQHKLSTLYDSYTKQYGLLNSRANNMAFSDDSSYALLCSLEILDENGNLQRKADMFVKRTIRHQTEITHVDTSSEALVVSLSEKAQVDLPYMAKLTGKSEEETAKELEGIIFKDPKSENKDGKPHYITADEYLSGNVRKKLSEAKSAGEGFAVNITALEGVQPKDLTASEIDVRLGATWLPPKIVEQFIHETLKPTWYAKEKLRVHYSTYTANWNIEGKSADTGNVTITTTYGTKRVNAYKILEDSLNLRDVRIFDKTTDAEGKEIRVLNKQETMIAQQKQQLLKTEFAQWVWKDAKRREQITTLYNEKFNSNRPREYSGSHIRFVGMNPEIELKPHQVNAVARILYGGNTLLAHVVGAGKTFEMVAAAMESKRLGLCQKSLIVVPNHLTEQIASEFLQLYPSANILVATKKDFETANRKKFCGRIATGDYDGVIIGHSQFEKIPMSFQRQCHILEEQLKEITEGIQEIKRNRGERFTIKQMERTKKAVKLKLDKLNSTVRKDDVVNFEELGVDKLFVDEAHSFKNLFLVTKMRNVAGLAQTEAQKSSDLFMKCRYIDELTGGKGIVFATGTPISNSMTEMYTMQRYLQYDVLVQKGLHHFDAWASTFGETITAIELAPEGTGYRAKTRFAKFYNLPELVGMFKEVADIQTADMLQLPVPQAEYHNIVLNPSEHQKEMVTALAERAEKVRAGMVDSTIDNMLKITNDGRKLALDQRLLNELLTDDDNSKVRVCTQNIFDIWQNNKEKNLTQLVFSDLSTPTEDGSFNVYGDIKEKLTAKGVPSSEIAFIHDAKTDTKKAELFANVRRGKVRVLIGSTAKMGAGTNVQNLLIAEHHIDVPWRPSDINQREGRIIRQGNTNAKIQIFRYVTENTFDSYMWQTIENKQKFISQIMTSKSPVRSCEDVDESVLTYAEIKALATGNPHIKERMDLDIDVSRLKLLKANYLSQKYSMEDAIIKSYPAQIRQLEEKIAGYIADKNHLTQNSVVDGFSSMVINGVKYTEKADAGAILLEICKNMKSADISEIGSYRGFNMMIYFDTFSKTFKLDLKHTLTYVVDLGTDIHGNITRIDNALESIDTKRLSCEKMLEDTKAQMQTAKVESEKPFVYEGELAEKSERLAALDALLNMDDKQGAVMDGEVEEVVVRERVGVER